MSLPEKSAAPTPENIQLLVSELNSWIYDAPETLEQCCGFYDKLDGYLGPWGRDEYPIGYGKRYCVAFNTNKKLRRNNVVWRWVAQTTIQLQSVLKDYVVECFKSGKLASLTPAELREFAFDSHPDAYDAGGLVNVVLDAPEMLPVIAEIPKAEFNPASENFNSSVKQVFITGGLVVPKTLASALLVRPVVTVLYALPAHRSVMTRGVRSSLGTIMQFQKTNESLSFLHRRIKEGKLDNIVSS